MRQLVRKVLTRLVHGLIEADLVDETPKGSHLQAEPQGLPDRGLAAGETRAAPAAATLAEPERIEIPIFHALTGLPNRLHFTEELRVHRRDGIEGVAGYLDLDHFKFVNHVHGHEIGDAVLIEVTRLLRAYLPTDASLACLGGDEFAFFIPGVGTEEAERLMNQLKDRLQRPMHPAGMHTNSREGGESLSDRWVAALHESVRREGMAANSEGITVSASIGLARFSGQGIGDLMRALDIALFAAKHRGRNCVVVFEDDTQAFAATRRELASAVIGLQARNQKLHSEARTDALTGLHNRLALDEVLDWTVGGDSLPWAGVAVAFVDVDHFGKFNRRYGDSSGDVALRRLAGAFRAAARSDDLIFRKGGEEFVVLMANLDHEAACGAAERIRSQVEQLAIPHDESATADVVTITVGVASGTEGTTVRALMVAAGGLATAAKNRHERNRVHAITGQ